MQPLPSSEFDVWRNNLAGYEVALEGVVFGYLFCHPEQKRPSSLASSRHLGISQNAAWRMKHRLMQVMLKRDNEKPLQGRVELDDFYRAGNAVAASAAAELRGQGALYGGGTDH